MGVPSRSLSFSKTAFGTKSKIRNRVKAAQARLALAPGANESTLHMRWPEYWSFSFSIIPSKEIPAQDSLLLLSHFSRVRLCATP